MRILGSVVAPSTSLVALRDPEITGGSPIRSEIIRDELVWDKAGFLQKVAHEFQRRLFVPFRLDQDVEDLAFGIDGAPEIDHAAIDFQIDLVQMPSRMGLRAALAQIRRNYWSEMVYPAPNGLVGDHDPTLGQQILDVAKAQGEPDIKPDRPLDDFGREAVAAIVDLGHHRWLRMKVTDGKPAGDVTMPSCLLGARGDISILRQQRTCAQNQSLNGSLDQVRKETANRSSTNSENIDGGRRRSTGPRLFVRPLLLFASVALVIGFVAVRTDVEPYKTPFFRLFFSNTLHMKAWLTTAAFLLGLGQLLTAARIYGKLRFPPEGRLYPLLHRWSGRAAILLTVPAAYHCIFKLGFGTYDARAFIHSLLGASFYGAFSAKVLIVRTSGYPGWALPMAGGVLFAILMVLWFTSAFWLFGTHGVSL